jgi:TonB-dependent SusC/RagA subfamily outer membrane receptor
MKKLIVVFLLFLSVGALAQKADSTKKEIRVNTSYSYSSLPPLVIVDGVKYKGDINTISPNDIESMEVLKDASSRTLYGDAATNGVILITTKKGKALKRSPVITAKADSTSINPLYIIDDKPSIGPGVLSKLNPNDIDNVSVFKDSASIAKYGPAGKNGVVIITTKAYKKKKGTPGSFKPVEIKIQ